MVVKTKGIHGHLTRPSARYHFCVKSDHLEKVTFSKYFCLFPWKMRWSLASIFQFFLQGGGIYAARKVSWLEKEQLKAALSDYWYTCDSSLQDLLLTIEEGVRNTHVLDKVYVRNNMTCNEHIEVSYYSSEMFKDVCHLCTSDELVTGQLATYPICNQCQKDTSKKPITKRKRAFVHTDSSADKLISCTFSCLFSCLFSCINFFY